MKTVKDILAAKGSEVWTISPTATVFEALRLMSDKDIGALIVREGWSPVAGIFSERDYARKVALTGKTSQGTRIEDVMTPAAQMAAVTSAATIAECMILMSQKQIRHLPVIEYDRPVGLVSIRDIVQALLEGQERQIRELQHLSEVTFAQNFDDQLKAGKE